MKDWPVCFCFVPVLKMCHKNQAFKMFVAKSSDVLMEFKLRSKVCELNVRELFIHYFVHAWMLTKNIIYIKPETLKTPCIYNQFRCHLKDLMTMIWSLQLHDLKSMNMSSCWEWKETKSKVSEADFNLRSCRFECSVLLLWRLDWSNAGTLIIHPYKICHVWKVKSDSPGATLGTSLHCHCANNMSRGGWRVFQPVFLSAAYIRLWTNNNNRAQS